MPLFGVPATLLAFPELAMVMKILSGLIAVLLVVAYVTPPAVKLKDPALIVVIIIGIVLMLIDLRQSLREREE
jgi:hypothetical protein